MHRQLILLLLCLFALPSWAQVDTLCHLSYAERRPALRNFYTDELNLPERNQAASLKKVEQIKHAALNAGDRDLELESALMLIHVESAFKLRSKKNLLKSLDSLLLLAENENVHWLRCRVLSFSGIMCFAEGYDYEQAFHFAERLNVALQSVTKEEFPEKQICYNQIGNFYYYFHDWVNAMHYCELAIKETPGSPKDQYLMLSCNLLGLIHEKNKNYDSAIIYYKNALNAILKHDATQNIWGGILKGNIGNCLYYKKRFNEARPLLQASLDSGRKYNEIGIVSDAYLTLGMIHLDENNLSEAQQNLSLSRYYCTPKNEYPRLEKLFPVMAELAQKQGNPLLRSLYLDSAITVKDSMTRKLNALYILRGTQKAVLLKEQQLEADKRLKTTQRNFLIAFMLIAMIGVMYIFHTQRKRFQQKRAIAELQLQQRSFELDLATEQLNAFANTISEKNRLVEELELKLQGGPNLDALLQLKESTILTDEEWDRFRKLFEQVHKGFTIRLKEKLPDLTQAETRFMVLAKLKFSNKEMANALNISTQAIRTTWYRLRKKLNLPEEGSLEELVETI